jgi:hypothetical protein
MTVLRPCLSRSCWRLFPVELPSGRLCCDETCWADHRRQVAEDAAASLEARSSALASRAAALRGKADARHAL